MTRSTYTFPYRFIDTTKFPRPYIPVTLRSKQREMQPMLALVDSGADFCMFDGALLELLAPDLNLNTLEQISLGGVAGVATGYVLHLEMGVEGHFFPTPAVFSFDFSPDEFGGLAGQLGFFDTYTVEFQRKAMQFVLR